MNSGFGARRRLHKEQQGKCYWCDEPMILVDRRGTGGGATLPKETTVDHVFTRFDMERRKHGALVGACSACNHARGVEREQEEGIEELRRRGRRSRRQ